MGLPYVAMVFCRKSAAKKSAKVFWTWSFRAEPLGQNIWLQTTSSEPGFRLDAWWHCSECPKLPNFEWRIHWTPMVPGFNTSDQMQGSFGTPWALTMSGYSTPAAFLLALCLTYGNLEAVRFCAARDMNEQDVKPAWMFDSKDLWPFMFHQHSSQALIEEVGIQYSVKT